MRRGGACQGLIKSFPAGRQSARSDQRVEAAKGALRGVVVELKVLQKVGVLMCRARHVMWNVLWPCPRNVH